MKTLTTQVLRTFVCLLSLTLINCETEQLENSPETITIENQDVSRLGTIPIKQTLEYIKNIENNYPYARVLELEVNLESIRQEEITNTDAKINLIDATTKFENVESTIMQIEIDGTTQTILYNVIPGETSTSERVVITDLGGAVYNIFDFSDGNMLGEINLNNYTHNDTDPCWGITCGIDLDEVIITTPYVSPYDYGFINHMSDNLVYQWNRSLNNYVSMGLAYANYYRQLALTEFEMKIKNKLTGKAKCVYDKLFRTILTNHNIITETLIAFGEGNFGDFNNEFDLVYRAETNLTNDAGEMLLGNFHRVNNDFIVTLNASQIYNRSSLEVATTILHESVHALLRRHYIIGSESFVSLFGEYMRNTTSSNVITHAIMREHYILQIVHALKQFDNNRENDTFYENLAWEGLHQFLTEEEIDAILETQQQARDNDTDCN